MKTQDIKNMASAYMQVLEKAKMDKVNPKALEKDFDDREDKDIDNDGDTDKSDEYLHNRRKAVKNAMKKEEVEELDEISRDTARSYISKASAHKTTGETPKKDRSSGVELAGKKAYGIGGKAKVMAKEEVEELDELSKKTLGSYVKKAAGNMAGNATVGAAQASSSMKQSSPDVKRNIKNRMTGIAKATDKLTKEEAENLDELSKKTLGSYIKKATGDAMTKSFKAGDVRDKDSTDNRLKAMGRQMGIAKAANKLAKESVELDELSKETLASYVKKADKQANKAIDSYSSAAARRSDFAPDTPAMAKNAKKFAKRDAGADLARRKLAKEEVEIDEAKKPMDTSDMGKWYDKNYPDKKKSKNMSMKEKLQLQKESILEREMTDAEKKKREDIVMGMKKNKADLEKRYGTRWKDVMYATATKQAMESADNALAMTKNLLTTKESFKTENTTWPVYAKIKENRAMHTKGAAPGDPKMMDKMTASDKAFIAVHNANDLDGIDSGIDGNKAAADTAKNAAAQVKAGAGMNRTGDQKTGDKNIVKSTEAK